MAAATNRSKVAPLVRGKVFRFTLTDACGFPQITNSSYTGEALVQVQSTANWDEGDDIKVRHASGIIGVFEPGIRSLLNFGLQIQISKVDPAVVTMLTGMAAIMSSDTVPLVVGWEEKALQIINTFFGFEVWTDTSASGCSSGSKLYGYMLYPMCGQGYVTVDNITDKECTITIHCNSYGSPSWGKGPYGNVTTPDGSSISGPVNSAASGAVVPGRLLVAVDPAAHRHFELTPVLPPVQQATTGPLSITLPTSY